MKLKYDEYVEFTIEPNTISAKKYCDEDTLFFISSDIRKTDMVYIFLQFLGSKCDIINVFSFNDFNFYDFYMDYTIKNCLTGDVPSDLISSGLKLYGDLCNIIAVNQYSSSKNMIDEYLHKQLYKRIVLLNEYSLTEEPKYYIFEKE